MLDGSRHSPTGLTSKKLSTKIRDMMVFDFNKQDEKSRWQVNYPDKTTREHKNLRTAVWYIVAHYLKPITNKLTHFVVEIKEP